MCLLCLGEFSTANASNGGEGGVDSYRSFQLMNFVMIESRN